MSEKGAIKASEKLIARLKRGEGLRLVAYRDQCPNASTTCAGKCGAKCIGDVTIGYGTRFYTQERAVKIGDTCTEAQADQWLRGHVRRNCEAIVDRVQVALTQAQYDALVMFVYNTGTLGIGLRQRLNAGDFEGAAAAMGEWIFSTNPITKKKYKNPGLIARRNEEIAMFRGADA